MYKKVCSCIALGVSSSLFAVQNTSIEDIDKVHFKKIYKNEQGKVFIPNSGFYVSISLSPDEESQRIYVPNAASLLKNSPVPILLGNPGTHSLEHPVDEAHLEVDGDIAPNHQSRFMFITWDNSPPITNFIPNIDHNNYFRNTANEKFYSADTEFHVKSKDSVSGVDTIYVKVNDKKTQNIGKNKIITLEEEDKYNLVIKSVDNVGNISKEKLESFTIDNSSPQSKHEIITKLTTDDDIIVGPKSKIILSSQDSLAGVRNVSYKYSGGKYQKYNTPITFNNLKEGRYTYSYFGVDNVSNKEITKDISLYLDKTAPKVDISLVGPNFTKNGTTYVSANSQFSLNAIDNKSVDKIYYNFDNNPVSQYNGELGFLSSYNEDAIQNSQNYLKRSVSFYAIDKVKNKSNKVTKNYIIDASTPVADLGFVGPHIYDEEIHYIREYTKVELSADDTLSGLKAIYTKTNNGEEKNYTEPFLVASLGDEKVKYAELSYTSVDNVNNKSKIKKVDIVIDEKAPSIFAHFSLNGLKANTVQLNDDNSQIETYTDRTRLYVGVTDDDVGVKSVSYQLEGQKRVSYSQPIRIKNSGTYSIKIFSEDLLGNESTKDYKFRIVSFKDKRIIKDDSLKLQYNEK